MPSREIGYFALILAAAITACASRLPPPEESARAIMRGVIARDFPALAARLSGVPLRTLLAARQADGFDSFCQRLLPISPPPSSWTIRFARANYQDDGSQLVLHLCFQYTQGEQRRLYETFWRMQFIDRGWKLVAY
ncbi:MAG: hypothetical protein LBC99_09065 [Spirochaetota bacterium]|nr:hypothetical protein [Spirochaetota bacterium]